MEELDILQRKMEDCTACPLRGDCIAPVGWFGDPHSPLVIVGEGPGGVEDDYGCPLIGPSGQLLDKALWSVKITRDHVLTTNVIKCRPRNNRTPTPEEAAFCAHRILDEELRLIAPKVIIALGGVALKYFKGPEARITKERGQWFRQTKALTPLPPSIPPISCAYREKPRLTPSGKSSMTLKRQKPKSLNPFPIIPFVPTIRSISLPASASAGNIRRGRKSSHISCRFFMLYTIFLPPFPPWSVTPSKYATIWEKAPSGT